MRRPFRLETLLLVLAMLGFASCDRNLAPIVPGEQPSQPDLSRIFPAPPESDDQGEGESARQAASANADADAASIRGTVEVSAELAGEVRPGSVLFIIARHSEALGGPPLAVSRVPDPRFPVDFEIGQRNMISQEMTFEGSFKLTARLDMDGDAMSRLPGDLQGVASAPVPAGSQGVALVLDSRI